MLYKSRLFHSTSFTTIKGEQDVLQEIGGTDYHLAPKHYDSSFTFENLVGYPFIVPYCRGLKAHPFSALPTTHQGLFGIKPSDEHNLQMKRGVDAILHGPLSGER